MPSDASAPASDAAVSLAPFAVRRSRRPVSPDSPRHEIAQVLLETDLVTVGRWRCPVASPYFVDSGPPLRHLCVFPRSSVWIRHDDAEAFVADATVVAFYNPGQHYRRTPIDADGDRCEWIGLRPAVVREIVRTFDAAGADDDEPRFARTHGPSDRRHYLAQRAAVDAVCAVEVPDVLAIEETLLHVVAAVAGAACPPATRAVAIGQGRALAEAARAVLGATFTRGLSLAALARRIGCSPFHLARVFRQHAGTSLHRHRTELRLRAALEALADPARDLSALAFDLGFSSHSHFTAVFRRAVGLTPSVYRASAAASRHVRRDHGVLTRRR